VRLRRLSLEKKVQGGGFIFSSRGGRGGGETGAEKELRCHGCTKARARRLVEAPTFKEGLPEKICHGGKTSKNKKRIKGTRDQKLAKQKKELGSRIRA